MADFPGLFAAGDATALIIAGFVLDEEFAAVSDAVTGTAPSTRIVRLTREDVEGAGIKLPPPGTTLPNGPPPADPAVFARLFKQKLAGL